MNPEIVEASDQSSPLRFEDVTRRLSMMSGDEGNESRYYHGALSHIRAFFSSPYVAIEIVGSDQSVQIEEGGDGKNGEFWKTILQDFMGESLASSSRARFKVLESQEQEVKAAMLAAPLWDGLGNRVGCVVCATQVANKPDALFRLSQLERLAIFLALFRKTEKQASSSGEGRAQKASTDVLAKVSGYRSQTELAFAITNGIRGRTDCDLVALALVKKQKVRMLSISGADDVKGKSPGVKAMISAFEEALDAKATIVWPQGRDWLDQDQPRNNRLHAQWSETAGGSHVVSIPLFADDVCVAILGMRKPGSEHFSPDQIENLKQTCGSYAPALELVERANRGLLTHGAHSFIKNCGDLFRPRMWLSTLMKLGLIALCLWVAFGSLNYQVPATTTLSQLGVRQIAAPESAVLKETLVQAGDPVEAGQILCRFNTEELDLEKTRLEAEREVALLDARRFLAEGLAVESGLARARVKSLTASLAITNSKIEHSVLRAPISGIVLSGDLDERVGDAVQQGEELFEIAPDDGWILTIKIDEKDIGLFEGEPQGEFSCHARPEDTMKFSINRIRPMSEALKNKNVFVAEAAIANPCPWMKSGMEGMAMIDAGKRRVWWITSRRALEWLKMNFWI